MARELALPIETPLEASEQASFSMDEESFRRFYAQTARPLRAYVMGCEVCADLALAASFLHDEASSARMEAASALPSPGQIWWKAQILAKRDATERATRPIVFFEKLAFAFGTLGVLAVGFWNWSSIQNWLSPLRTAWTHLSTAGTSPLLNPFLYLSTGLVLLIVMGMFTLYVAWVEQ